jgi:hypothetical protein
MVVPQLQKAILIAAGEPRTASSNVRWDRIVVGPLFVGFRELALTMLHKSRPRSSLWKKQLFCLANLL